MLSPVFSLTNNYVNHRIDSIYLAEDRLCCEGVKSMAARVLGAATSVFALFDLLYHSFALIVKSVGCLLKTCGVKQIPPTWTCVALSLHIQQIGRAFAGALLGTAIGIIRPESLKYIYGESPRFFEKALQVLLEREDPQGSDALLPFLEQLNSDIALCSLFRIEQSNNHSVFNNLEMFSDFFRCTCLYLYFRWSSNLDGTYKNKGIRRD